MLTEQGFARVVSVVRRRTGPVVVAAGLTALVALATVWRLEPGYRASAVVRAIESQPAKEYVAPTVTEPMGERLKTLRLIAMSRPILARVAKQLALPAKLNRPLDQIVDGMRARMDVKVEGEDTFLLSYEDSDPARARDVIDRVAAEFMEEQVRRREVIAVASERALSDEAAALRPTVAKAEATVREFKFSHQGTLPEQLESNLRALDQATMEVNIQSQNLEAENERRRQLLGAAMSPLRHQEELLTTALHEARTHYTAEHPEVRRIDEELSEVRARRADEERALRSDLGRYNPELASIDSEIRHTTATLNGLRERQREVRERVAATAKSAGELEPLAAALELVRGKYQAALGKLHDAELATVLEHRLASLRYELVEGASLPGQAAHPNKPLFALGGLVLAALVGLGVGFVIEQSDTRLHAPRELGLLRRPLTLLASIPDLDDAAVARPKR